LKAKSIKKGDGRKGVGGDKKSSGEFEYAQVRCTLEGMREPMWVPGIPLTFELCPKNLA
jgi:hypothetical protein